MSTDEQIKKDMYFMQRAIDEAKAAYREGEIPIGAVVVCRDRIIARTHNLTETLNDVTAHAEMQAITIAENELGVSTYKIARYMLLLNLASCVPEQSDGRNFNALYMGALT